MDCSDFTERRKNEALVNGLTKGKKHSLFGAFYALIRMPRGYQKKSSTQVLNPCYSDLLLDGGVADKTQNTQIDGGTADNDSQLCSVDGKEI
jgi:hypothetical protein